MPSSQLQYTRPVGFDLIGLAISGLNAANIAISLTSKSDAGYKPGVRPMTTKRVVLNAAQGVLVALSLGVNTAKTVKALRGEPHGQSLSDSKLAINLAARLADIGLGTARLTTGKTLKTRLPYSRLSLVTQALSLASNIGQAGLEARELYWRYQEAKFLASTVTIQEAFDVSPADVEALYEAGILTQAERDKALAELDKLG